MRFDLVASARGPMRPNPFSGTPYGTGYTWSRSEALELRRVRGERAGMALPIHPHMLRHGCGFKLANDGVDMHALQQVSVATGHPFDTYQ